MPISDDDLNYLRNINTRPGPNAGKSIDPTKPGPDADSASPDPDDTKVICPNCTHQFRAISVMDQARLAQSDAGPVALKTRFEVWAFTRGHRNFTKSGGGYLLPEIQKDWLAFKAGATALPPDCPTDGVAARQGNGG